MLCFWLVEMFQFDLIYCTYVQGQSDHVCQVNPSTPHHKCWGLLRVDPERRLPFPPSKAGLSAVERVNNLLCQEAKGYVLCLT